MVDVVTPEPPILVTIPRVELIDVGTWAISNDPEWHPSADDLAHAVAALDCPAVRRPVLKFGHVPGPGDPALGFVDDMATTGEGQKLVGDWAGVPAWLASTDDDGNNVISSAYPDRSVEGEYDYVCQLGHVHPFVVHAVALLGVSRPGVGTLQSLIDLYGEAPQPAETAVTASAPKEATVPAQVAAAATTDDVRRAYYAGPGASWDLWIREMYVDPPELIVENDADASLIRVTYTVDGAGAVTFGDPQPVKVQYVAARAAAQRPVIAWASHTEARPGQRPDPQTPAADTGSGSTPTEGSPAVAFSDEQITTLRQRLGVADDADETTILAALDEALTERADPPAAPTETTTTATETVPVAASVIPDEVRKELNTVSTELAEIKASKAAEVKASVISAARRDGKFKPAEQAAWERRYDEAPEIVTEILAAKAAGSAVPVTVGGYSASDDDTNSGEFDHLFPPTAQEA